MCAQDLTNTQGVNTPVAGSLRVRQPYEVKDKRQGTIKPKANVDCPVKRQSQQTRGGNSNNDSKLRRVNESTVTVNLTRIQSKRQYKQQVCTDKMIKNKMTKLEQNTRDQHDNDNNKKASNEGRQIGLQKGADGRKFH